MSAAAGPFLKVPSKADFPAIEREVLELWDRLDAFAESNRRRAGGDPFVFYDGPPFATGTPHYGHLLAGTIKDIVPRFWNMRGHPVERRFGWDCHGLPIEALAQKALDLAGSAEIAVEGVDVFNRQCASMVATYVERWRETVTRMGRWVDFDDDYKTMDRDFMETVWWVFKQLHEQGRIYRAHRVMPYSPKLATPLAKNEVKDDNYRPIDDPAITVRFCLREHRGFAPGKPVSMLAWTTTPWTLPENLALCVGPEIDYVAIDDGDEIRILAEARVGAYYGEDAPEPVARFKGEDLRGWRYEPLMPHYADRDAFVVLADGYVTTEDGTGIVHQAPAFGEDDYRICRAAGLPLVDPLDEECRFTDEIPEYAGTFCKDADKAIIARLKDDGKLVRRESYRHPYPFCDRTDFPLIYRAIDAWYVRVEDLRERLVANNQRVRWVPEFVGGKRFSNWLADAVDWNVSRNRFWGSCIPIWVAEDDPDDWLCVGSIAELEELSGTRVEDLHKHVVDEVVIERDGKTYRRTPEVLDCWFESGAMPYASHHYPFSRTDELDDFFPAHFIAEGLDQTRGWFYTLLVLGTALFDRSPYRNVVVNGIVLAEDGSKMSKSKGNYPPPEEVLEEYGADALRAYLIDSPLVRGDSLRFSEKGLKEILRTVVIPYWNSLSFFTTYAEVDGFDPRATAAPRLEDRAELDRWICSELESLTRDVNREMERYRLDRVVPRLTRFVDDLTNWYIRRSRRRFWKSEDDADKAGAYATLYAALCGFAKILAPFMPFLTERVHQLLVVPVDAEAPESVHWCDYPRADEDLIDPDLERRMEVIRRTVAQGRRLREDRRIRVRQPLPGIVVVHRDPEVREAVLQGAEILREELNVKEVAVEPDESAHCELVVKPNFQVLRERCPDRIKSIVPALKQWSFTEVGELEAGGTIEVAGVALGLDDLLLERRAAGEAAVATDGEITVVLETRIDDSLRREGLAREVTSAIQQERKRQNLDVADRIRVSWDPADSDLAAAIDEHRDAIAAEVLAERFERDGVDVQPVEVAGHELRFRVSRV